MVISDIVDQNRALVDRPDETRHVISLKRLALTDFKIDIPRLAKKSVLAAKLKETGVFAKFAGSAWGKKLAARSAKAATSDFDRHKAMVVKCKRSRAIRLAVHAMKKGAKKAAPAAKKPAAKK